MSSIHHTPAAFYRACDVIYRGTPSTGDINRNGTETETPRRGVNK